MGKNQLDNADTHVRARSHTTPYAGRTHEMVGKAAAVHTDFWSFVGREVAIGALQAVGGIALYALAIWAIVHKYINVQSLKHAVTARAQVLDDVVVDNTTTTTTAADAATTSTTTATNSNTRSKQ